MYNFGMTFRKRFSGLFLVLAMAGCGTIYDAQEAQRALEDKGSGEVSAEVLPKFCLTDYSLRELVDFAMTNRPSVAASALAVTDARLALRQIAADAPLVSYSPWTSPHISLSGGYAAASESGKQLHWATEGNASAGLSLQLLLYDFGRNEARACEQVERVIAAESEFIRAGYEVFEEVSAAYFTLLENDAMLQVALTNELEMAQHLRQTKEELSVGEKQMLDLARAKLDLAEAREKVISASNDVATAGAELMRSLGIDASRGSRNEVYPASGLGLAKVMRGFPHTTYSVDTAFQLARTNAPAMAIVRAQLRAASHNVDRAVADLMPEVNATVSLSWVDPLWAWHWGVDAVQSVFQGFRKTTEVDRAVVQMKMAATAVDEAEQRLSCDLETAITVRDNARKATESARASVVHARENFDMVKAQYAEGEASRVDFTDAANDYVMSLGRRISAFYACQRSEARLFALSGLLPTYREELVQEK